MLRAINASRRPYQIVQFTLACIIRFIDSVQHFVANNQKPPSTGFQAVS